MATIKRNTKTKVTTRLAADVKKAKPKVAKLILKEHQTRVQVLQAIADETNLKRVEVAGVFAALDKIIKGHMAPKGSGKFMIPMIGLKLIKVRRKATKKRNMVSPLTGGEVTIPAKPARDDIKLIALKNLKGTVLA